MAQTDELSQGVQDQNHPVALAAGSWGSKDVAAATATVATEGRNIPAPASAGSSASTETDQKIDRLLLLSDEILRTVRTRSGRRSVTRARSTSTSSGPGKRDQSQQLERLLRSSSPPKGVSLEDLHGARQRTAASLQLPSARSNVQRPPDGHSASCSVENSRAATLASGSDPSCNISLHKTAIVSQGTNLERQSQQSESDHCYQRQTTTNNILVHEEATVAVNSAVVDANSTPAAASAAIMDRPLRRRRLRHRSTPSANESAPATADVTELATCGDWNAQLRPMRRRLRPTRFIRVTTDDSDACAVEVVDSFGGGRIEQSGGCNVDEGVNLSAPVPMTVIGSEEGSQSKKKIGKVRARESRRGPRPFARHLPGIDTGFCNTIDAGGGSSRPAAQKIYKFSSGRGTTGENQSEDTAEEQDKVSYKFDVGGVSIGSGARPGRASSVIRASNSSICVDIGGNGGGSDFLRNSSSGCFVNSSNHSPHGNDDLKGENGTGAPTGIRSTNMSGKHNMDSPSTFISSTENVGGYSRGGSGSVGDRDDPASGLHSKASDMSPNPSSRRGQPQKQQSQSHTAARRPSRRRVSSEDFTASLART